MERLVLNQFVCVAICLLVGCVSDLSYKRYYSSTLHAMLCSFDVFDDFMFLSGDSIFAVMLMGTLLYGVKYTFPEYLCTFLVAGGVSSFALLKVRLCSIYLFINNRIKLTDFLMYFIMPAPF